MIAKRKASSVPAAINSATDKKGRFKFCLNCRRQVCHKLALAQFTTTQVRFGERFISDLFFVYSLLHDLHLFATTGSLYLRVLSTMSDSAADQIFI